MKELNKEYVNEVIEFILSLDDEEKKSLLWFILGFKLKNC